MGRASRQADVEAFLPLAVVLTQNEAVRDATARAIPGAVLHVVLGVAALAAMVLASVVALEPLEA